jgi:hypothetical protein
MKTQNLIDELSKNIKPVPPLPVGKIRMLYILGSIALGVAGTFLLFSIRHDLTLMFSNRQFILGALILFLGFLATAYSLAQLQLPTVSSNVGSKKYFLFGLLMVSFLALGYFVKGAFFSTSESFSNGFSPTGIKCSIEILFLSVLPGFFLFYFLRKGATSRYVLMGTNAGLCCGMLGAFALQFSCPSNLATHLLTWHLVAPFSALAVLGAFVGRNTLKW